MLMFCSTSAESRASLPLLSQAELVHQTDYANIWLVKARPDSFIQSVHRLLSEHQLISACVLRKPPPTGKEWVYYEWHGRLLIDTGIVEEVLANAPEWEQVQIRSDLGLAIFRPKADFESAARKYDDLLRRGERGGVVLHRSWIDTEGAKKQIFGRYADPKIGGAIALLSLSGAARLGADDTFTLRTPAALNLDIDNSEHSLVSEPIRRGVQVRCVASQDMENLRAQKVFKTSSEKWIKLASEARDAADAGFFVALELEGKQDPTIAIRRGTVFEQQKLTPVQTLAAAIDVNTIVNVGEVKPLIIPAYCLNRELGPPRGELVRPTPFVYTQASGSQQEVWRARES